MPLPKVTIGAPYYGTAFELIGRDGSAPSSLEALGNNPIAVQSQTIANFVLNAHKVKVTGRKADVIEYDTYSRYPGGRHLYSYKRMNQLHPERVIQLAVKRMLPKNKLGKKQLTKLKIYKSDKHPHTAQRPKELKLA